MFPFIISDKKLHRVRKVFISKIYVGFAKDNYGGKCLTLIDYGNKYLSNNTKKC